MSTRYADAVLDMLIAMTRDLGKHATEIELPSQIYLNVAADFIALRAFAAPEWTTAMPKRAAYDYLRSMPMRPTDPAATLDDLYREVCVGSSFMIQGPYGKVTIREAHEPH